MKKAFLALLLAGCTGAAFAQVDSLAKDTTDQNMNNSLTTTEAYNAYSTYTATLPTYMESYVVRDYPAATGVRWQQVGDWWHGYYVNNGVPTHMYYNGAGQTFTVALPVRQSLIPETVTAKAIDMYGPVLYDITKMKGTTGQDIYHVRILENGVLSDQYMDENGNKVIDIYRIDVADAELNKMNASPDTQTMSTENNVTTDMNKDAKMKIKTKEADGTKTKTKIENGNVKTKKDN